MSASLAPGLATGEAPDIARAMRDWARLQTAVLEKEKTASKLSFNLQGGACAAPGCGRGRPAMRRWAASEHAPEQVRRVGLEGFRAKELPLEAATVRFSATRRSGRSGVERGAAF